MDLIWKEIDHKLVRHKLSLISQEMQPKVVSEVRRVMFECRKSGNAGAIKAALVDVHVTLTDEWLDRVYQAYCDVWSIQGNSKSAVFIRAVFENALVPTISVRQGAILSQFRRMARSISPAGNALVRALEQLRGKWWDKLEIEAGTCDHAKQSVTRTKIPTSPTVETPNSQANTTQAPPARSTPENSVWHLQTPSAPRDYISVWEQIDRDLVNLKLQEPLNRHIEEINEERRTIEYYNRDNRHAAARATLQMVERRAEEWLTLQYKVYCEVWELQNEPKSANFLRTLRDNIIEPTVRARTTAEIYNLGSKWKNCGLPGPERLQAQLAGFRRAMQKLETRWKTRLEIEAKEWEHKTRQRAVTADFASPQVSKRDDLQGGNRPANPERKSTKRRRKPKRHPKPRVQSTADRVREARICATIVQGNRGLQYCLDVKAQGVVTRVTWRSDGCPKEYPDAYTHPNRRWRELIQKEKNRYARKIKKG